MHPMRILRPALLMLALVLSSVVPAYSQGPPPPPPPPPVSQPTLTLSLNQTAFRTGNTLRVGLQASNVGPGFSADFYFPPVRFAIRGHCGFSPPSPRPR